MTDLYKVSKALADHVDLVVVHLAQDIDVEPAILRVMEHLQIVLQDALEGGNPEDMAIVLRPKTGERT
jgi:hypothetical protein